jgi:hypothetical protein
MSNRPHGLYLYERQDLPEAIERASGDVFHYFEVIPLEAYEGGAYEVAEQLLEQSPTPAIEALIDEAIGEGHREFALVPHIPYRGHSGVKAGDIARLYDVPPWIIGDYRKPRFAKIRWALRKFWPVEARPKG